VIPEFNKDGYLPKGIYKATLEEINERFGKGSARREKLFRNIISLVKLLRKHKGSISRFLLNGSYVTSKEEPRDFDYILILKNDFDLDSPEARQLLCSEELFNAHMLFAMEEDTTECQEVIGFFGHDREARSKGLVEVIL
jgi:hypothetical protein